MGEDFNLLLEEIRRNRDKIDEVRKEVAACRLEITTVKGKA